MYFKTEKSISTKRMFKDYPSLFYFDNVKRFFFFLFRLKIYDDDFVMDFGSAFFMPYSHITCNRNDEVERNKLMCK